jgi:hypothetical protein
MKNSNTDKLDQDQKFYQQWLAIGNKGTLEDFLKRKEQWQPVAALTIHKP